MAYTQEEPSAAFSRPGIEDRGWQKWHGPLQLPWSFLSLSHPYKPSQSSLRSRTLMPPRLLWPFPPMWGLVRWSGQQSWTEAEHPLHTRGNLAGQHFSPCPERNAGPVRAVTAAGPMSPSSQALTCLKSWIPCSGSRQGWRHMVIVDQSHKLFSKISPGWTLWWQLQFQILEADCSEKEDKKAPHKHRQNLHSSFHQSVSFASCSASPLLILTSSWAWANLQIIDPHLPFCSDPNWGVITPPTYHPCHSPLVLGKVSFL